MYDLHGFTQRSDAGAKRQLYDDVAMEHPEWVMVSGRTCINKQLVQFQQHSLQHNSGTTFLSTCKVQQASALAQYCTATCTSAAAQDVKAAKQGHIFLRPPQLEDACLQHWAYTALRQMGSEFLDNIDLNQPLDVILEVVSVTSATSPVPSLPAQ